MAISNKVSPTTQQMMELIYLLEKNDPSSKTITDILHFDKINEWSLSIILRNRDESLDIGDRLRKRTHSLMTPQIHSLVTFIQKEKSIQVNFAMSCQ